MQASIAKVQKRLACCRRTLWKSLPFEYGSHKKGRARIVSCAALQKQLLGFIDCSVC
jgi:hypothetical protein